MDSLFKNLWDKAQCQKNGVCSLNPVLNALDAVIVNELRQIAFYIVHLNELNFYNENIMHKAIEMLCANITDTSYSEAVVLSFFKNLKSIKQNLRDFYEKKSAELNISYEFITFGDCAKPDNITNTELIKTGEKIIKLFYTNVKEEKSRLINLIAAFCKMNAINLYKLSKYKTPPRSFYFEILRLLSLTNYTGTREDKFIRRIKEFSNVAFKIQQELFYALEEKYGKRESGILDTGTYEGKSIFVLGEDLDEIYNLAQKAPDINIYFTPQIAHIVTYPAFKKLPNIKGLWGTGDAEFDFANFKGAIYLTQDSALTLDTAFRGKIFTTKQIPSERAVKIEKNNIEPLIYAAREMEGFLRKIEGRKIPIEYNIEKYEKFIIENEDKKILISMGGEDKFQDYSVLKFEFPNEIQGLFRLINLSKKENTCVYFTNCTKYSINMIGSLLNKNLHKIYLKSCQTQSVNPHIADCLKNDFKIEVV